MSANKPKKTVTGRLDDLETKHDVEKKIPALNIVWHCYGEPEPVFEPGTRVIEWLQNDEIRTYTVPGGKQKKTKKSAQTEGDDANKNPD